MKKILPYLLAFISVLVCSLFTFSSLDKKADDYFQRPLPGLSEQKNIIMININDTSVENIGTWPFSRDVYSQMLMNLKEFGTEAVVFDLSFLDHSTARVDEDYVHNKLPQYIDNYMERINDNIGAILDAYEAEMYTASDAADAKELLFSLNEQTKNEINTSISYVIQSQDESLANALKFFENSYLTLTFDDEFALSDYEEEYLKSSILLNNVTAIDDKTTPVYSGVQTPIFEFLSNTKKAGFVNASPDTDGYLRRIHLVYKYNDNYYGQLVFVPLLNHFGNPEVEITSKYITLKNARIDANTRRDIKIPRAEDGSIIVKYPNKKYSDYNYISLWDIYRLSVLESEIVENLQIADEFGFFFIWDEIFDDASLPLDIYNNAEYIKDELANGEDEESGITYETYYEYRNAFFDSLSKFFNEDYEAALVDSAEDDEELVDYIKEIFAGNRELFTYLMTFRKQVSEKVKDAICIVGTCASSTTDYGLTQYEEQYPNPGVHYTVANQILTEDFVDDSPLWISIVIALVVCLLYIIIATRLKGTGQQLITGVLFLIITASALLGFFIVTKVYIGVVVPVFSIFLLFVINTTINLLTASKDKKFITNAFSQCLSKDVVNDIINNPSSLKLGGVSRPMTAIFTDIQKFSGFSELLDAAELVALLNFYLTKMSDIIMEERGTVDKYEGDAIIALVGAPLEMPDHASRACAAAIKMKKAEVELNKKIVEIAQNGKPDDMEMELHSAFQKMVHNKRTIFTRIGINSGEMVAGFMGSENKKNYTMMGNNVNLASRLEGVNKQYSTGGILISEATRKMIGDEFVVRSLDRVQVMNVKKPIRLYELLDFKTEANTKLQKFVDAWENSMKTFETGNYQKALEMFKKLSEIRPSDNVCKYYISLIEKFFIHGKYPTDADDFGVAYNNSNPEDMPPEWAGTSYEIKGTFRLLQK